jgi:hypothetical protein
MPLDAPFRLGPFIVDVHGRLQPSDPATFPSFHIAWRGCPIHARLAAEGAAPGSAHLAMSAVIGRVPSTAGGDAARNQERRRVTFSALQSLGSGKPNLARLRLMPDHRFAMETQRELPMPVSAGDLVTQITCFLLDLGPYLDLLAEADVPVETIGGDAAGKDGSAKI